MIGNLLGAEDNHVGDEEGLHNRFQLVNVVKKSTEVGREQYQPNQPIFSVYREVGSPTPVAGSRLQIFATDKSRSVVG